MKKVPLVLFAVFVGLPAIACAAYDLAVFQTVRPKSLSGDKGYYVRGFVRTLRDRGIRPHIACIEGRHMPGLDERTRRHESYRISQRKREIPSAKAKDATALVAELAAPLHRIRLMQISEAGRDFK